MLVVIVALGVFATEALVRSLRIGAGLFYKALWPILFGVLITAAIETFVDKERMAEVLGGRDLLTTGKATVAGAVSSACTFGAVTIAQTLFKKGASPQSLTFTDNDVTYQFHSEPCQEAFRQQVSARGDWKQQLKTQGGWYRIAVSYFNTMGKIYKTVLFGFLLAGFIVGLIPTQVWAAVFLEPTNFLAVVENAAVGVLAAVLSFIGSIGNVPFAAALWVSGVSFAGVIACIYADLITIPVLQLWGQFFGRKAMWYIFGVFAATMTLSAVAMEYAFSALGWIPQRPQAQDLVGFDFELTLTSVMTVVFLALTAALFLLMRRGTAHAEQREEQTRSRDPICGVLVLEDEAAATRQSDGQTYFFTSKSCARAFDRQEESSGAGR